jgi:CHAT domain-containing protein
VAAAELNALTLAKLSPLTSNRRIAIAPDGALWYTPWAMLPGVEAREIVVVPSATAVVRIKADRRLLPAKQLAVFADPVYDKTDARLAGKDWQATAANLPVALREAADSAGVGTFGRLRFSREEALAISRYANGGQLLLALDFDASREAASSGGLEQYRVVHYAAHTLLNNEHPELSGIVLSLIDRNGKTQDGFLRLFDIYHLRLSADLVVLSGCRTALGKELRGEGLVGLTQGFLSAGADQVLASLWPVEDQATAEFMTRFYEDLLKKRMPASKALQAAQESMRAQPAWRAPYYWAAFQLVGDLR